MYPDFVGRFIHGYADLWGGKKPLARSFWIYFVLGSFLWIFIGSLIAVPLWRSGQNDLAFVIMLCVRLIYPFFAGVGVWRAATASQINADGIMDIIYAVSSKLIVLGTLLILIAKFTGLT